MNLRSAIGSLGAVLDARSMRIRVLPVRTLVATSVAVAGFGVASLVVRPELWMVEHVRFEGRQRASVAELRHLADLPNGTAVWQVDLERVERGVARHPWVRAVHARFEWPATVAVAIEEHAPVALLHLDGRLWCVDEGGVPFLPATAADLDLPQLTGFDGLAASHPALPGLAIAHALSVITALDARRLVPRERISEVSFSETRGLLVVAGEARIAFGLGETDLGTQLDRLAQLVSRGVSLDAPTYVDLAPAQVALVRPLSPPALPAAAAGAAAPATTGPAASSGSPSIALAPAGG